GEMSACEAILLMRQADRAANYFSLQSTTREIDLLDQAIGLRNEGVDIFNKRLQAGIGSEFEVQRGKTEAASAQAQWEAARRRRAELINALALLCGKAPSRFEPAVATNTHLPAIAADIPSAVLERRPDVAQAER